MLTFGVEKNRENSKIWPAHPATGRVTYQASLSVEDSTRCPVVPFQNFEFIYIF
jgi:hypothetical protein